MKHRLMWVVVCVLFFQLLYTQVAYSTNGDTNQYGYDWTFEPKVDGSVSGEVIITLGESCSSYPLTFLEGYQVEVTKAEEVETEEIRTINWTTEDEITYVFEFDPEKEEGDKFLVKFDLMNIVKGTEKEIYIFSWGCMTDHKTSHKATVILPVKHEVLSAELLDPTNIFSDQDQICVIFEENVPELKLFEFKVTFSKKGVELIEKAQEYYNQGEYVEAISAYEKAIEFYSNPEFSMVNNRNINESVAELDDWVKRIEYILEGMDIYDWTFEPKVDGSVSGEITITLGEPCSSYSLMFPEAYQVKVTNAEEVGTEETRIIQWTTEDEIIYVFEFDDEKEKGFQFLVEFDLMNMVKKRDVRIDEETTKEVFYFFWEWPVDPNTAHIAEVVLPEKHELLSVDLQDFKESPPVQGQISDTFEKSFFELEGFKFEMTFSKGGKELREEGETYFDQGQYDEAKLTYQSAIRFYSNYPMINNQKKYEILIKLQKHLLEIYDNLQIPQEPFEYDWTFKPSVNDSTHVEVEIALGGPRFLYWFSFPEDYFVKNKKAPESGNSTDVIPRIEYEGEILHIVDFKSEKGRGYRFLVKFDLENMVNQEYEEIDEETTKEVFGFSWEWPVDPNTAHTAKVVLPKDHELLSVEPLHPIDISLDQDPISVKFEKIFSEQFKFKMIFSKRGKELTDKGKTQFRLGQNYFEVAETQYEIGDDNKAKSGYTNAESAYKNAELAYERAINFYERFLMPGPDKDSLLTELRSSLKEIKDILQELGKKFDYVFTFELKDDGSVNGKVVITLGESCSSIPLPFPEGCQVEVTNAEEVREEETEAIHITYRPGDDEVTYIFEFDSEKEEGYKFLVEFNLKNVIEEKKDICVFSWEWEIFHKALYKAEVILPKKYEFLSHEYLNPKECHLDQDPVSCIYEKDTSRLELFELKVKYSRIPLIPRYIYLGIFLLFLIPLLITIQREYFPIFKEIESNPYIAGNPITSREMFFGREDVFRDIEEKFSARERNITIVMHGERKTGKTSILRQIENGRLGGEFVPVYIDVQGMADVNTKGFLTYTTSEIAKSLVKFEVITPGSNGYSKIKESREKYKTESDPYKVFSDFLEEVLHVLKEKYLLVMVDEYEDLWTKVEKNQLSPDLLTYIRHLMQNKERLAFIFTGSKGKEEFGDERWFRMLSGAASKKIGFLKEKDALALMKEPVSGKIRYYKKTKKKLLRLTAYQPFFLQLFLHDVVNHVNRNKTYRVTVRDIDYVLRDNLDSPPPHMTHVWRDSTPEERMILSALAEIIGSEDQYVSVGEVREKLPEKVVTCDKKMIRPNQKVIRKTLESLFRKEILDRKKREAAYVYNFKIDYIRYWVKNERPLFRTIEEIEESKEEEK